MFWNTFKLALFFFLLFKLAAEHDPARAVKFATGLLMTFTMMVRYTVTPGKP